MTREEAKERLQDILEEATTGEEAVCYVTSYDEEAIKMAIKALEEPQWIPCSSGEMPEEGQIVLATHLGGLDPSRQVIEHIYSGGKFLLNWEMDMEMLSPTFGQRYMGKVIAWMPLPEAWRGDVE